MNYKVFDTLLEPIFVVNADKVIIYCNDIASQVIGMNLRKIVKANLVFDKYFLFSEKNPYFEDISKITDPVPFTETNFETLDESKGRVQYNIQKISDNEWLIFFRDVTLEEKLQLKYRQELEQKETYIIELKNAQSQLKKYSEKLEVMVEERTSQLKQMNVQLEALLNSLGQGFLIFNPEGIASNVYSKACEAILETNPTNKHLVEILKIDENQKQSINKWLATLFGNFLPFEDVASLGPSKFRHSQNRIIDINYYPLHDQDQKLTGVVLVATDNTELTQAKEKAESEQKQASLLLNLIKYKLQAINFIEETKIQIEDLTQSFKDQNVTTDDAFRVYHTIKGGAATFGAAQLAEICHKAEDELKQDFQVKKQTLLLDQIKNEFQSFVAFTEKIFGKKVDGNNRIIEHSKKSFEYFLKKLPTDKLKLEFEDSFIKEPILNSFLHFDTTVEKTALLLNKKVSKIKFINEGIKIDPDLIKTFIPQFTHLIRNAIDHGIESPEERLEKNKPEYGLLQISFHVTENNFLQIKLIDDGRGINTFKLRKKLQEKNHPKASGSDEEVLLTIFEPSISTQDQATEISGRGIGLNSVLECVKNLNGQIYVKSKLNVGTEFLINLDLSLPKINIKVS